MKKLILPIKLAIDFAMSCLFLLLIGYHLLPDKPHEWLGATLFVLFLLHNALNWRWYRSLFKGRFTATRLLQTTTIVLLWLAMLCCIISSFSVSGYVFAFLGVKTSAIGRSLHLLATAWAFVLVSVHTGYHWQIVIAMSKKCYKPSDKTAVIMKWCFRIILLAICVFGCYIFAIRKMWEELFLLTEFKWFDYDKTVIGYFLESLSVMVLFAAIGYYLKASIKKVVAARKARACKQAEAT